MKITAAAELQDLAIFRQVPLEQLSWLLEHGHLQELLPGQTLFEKGDPAENMYVVLEGQVDVQLVESGRLQQVFSFHKGEITGVMPLSRLTHTKGQGVATKPTLLLVLHKSNFLELERNNPDLLQVLVSIMTDRVRDFTQMQQFNEKLMALGKLSAGLAHELNNPSAAIVRSSAELLRIHHNVPQKFKRVMMMHLSPAQVDQVVEFTFAKIQNCKLSNHSMLERSRQEDELLEWLEDRQLENTYALADTFVETGLGLEDLDHVEKILEGQNLSEVLEWVANALSTERVINDIQVASQRIFELVSAVKTYSHMDQSQAKQQVPLPAGIQSTLTMLGHKLKEKRIQVQETYAPNLPAVSVYPGELNQVWTNLLDNAIDAAPDQGTIAIKAWPEGTKVKVSITDNGTGIPQEAMSRIFDPFFTTKPVGKGSGLGLDIVRKIIQHHDAEIFVESVPSQTTFTVQLPL
ncbi:ATP-binding protein [Rufibacter hautae]|uniref:histidine kinase n=1 Tax=Rufibacter hautae TaxID=2595005 RepID=A0A5B6TIZ7_9BACT|nr:ATP-binding protein [Rufibacter hautae]KAA3439417.1 cyclic nucleotide-binding domain-containing protein [Rufibacter hautae]